LTISKTCERTPFNCMALLTIQEAVNHPFFKS
jgi:hypothetical protein